MCLSWIRCQATISSSAGRFMCLLHTVFARPSKLGFMQNSARQQTFCTSDERSAPVFALFHCCLFFHLPSAVQPCLFQTDVQL